MWRAPRGLRGWAGGARRARPVSGSKVDPLLDDTLDELLAGDNGAVPVAEEGPSQLAGEEHKVLEQGSHTSPSRSP